VKTFYGTVGLIVSTMILLGGGFVIATAGTITVTTGALSADLPATPWGWLCLPVGLVMMVGGLEIIRRHPLK